MTAPDFSEGRQLAFTDQRLQLDILVQALRTGQIAGAALDVFEFEPAVTHELLSMEQVVLTPHLGSATRPAREAMGMLAVEALRAVLLRHETPPNTVA